MGRWNDEMLQLRNANSMDAAAIAALFREVSAAAGGLARRPEEIHEGDVATILERCAERGFATVAEGPRGLLGALYCYAPEPALFARCWSNTTLAVAPETQGQGLGRLLLEAAILAAPQSQPPIDRLELFVRASNQGAQRLYRRLGFIEEGRLRNRLRTPEGALEDDVLMAYLWERPA